MISAERGPGRQPEQGCLPGPCFLGYRHDAQCIFEELPGDKDGKKG